MSCWYRGALCDHSLPTTSESWTHVQHADITPLQSATQGLLHGTKPHQPNQKKIPNVGFTRKPCTKGTGFPSKAYIGDFCTIYFIACWVTPLWRIFTPSDGVHFYTLKLWWTFTPQGVQYDPPFRVFLYTLCMGAELHLYGVLLHLQMGCICYTLRLSCIFTP